MQTELTTLFRRKTSKPGGWVPPAAMSASSLLSVWAPARTTPTTMLKVFFLTYIYPIFIRKEGEGSKEEREKKGTKEGRK